MDSNEFDFEDDYETSQYAEYTKTVLSQLKNIKTSVKLYMDSDLFEVDGEVVTKLPVTVEVTGRSINALGSISEEPARAGL